MMEPFRISDALRCSLLNSPRGPNLACPRVGSGSLWLRQNATLWHQALTQRQDRIMLGWWDGLRLGGLISARTRAGCHVWEVDHLYLPATGPDLPSAHNGNALTYDGNSLELLERLILTAGCRSAERIFLRLPTDSSAIDLARRTGFFPCYEEALYQGMVDQIPSNGEVLLHSLRSLLPSDEYALFQLFNAATPGSVRVALGLTFDQWRDAREVQGGNGPEWVTESKGRITSWLKAPLPKQCKPGQLLLHPDHCQLLPGLLKLAHNRVGVQRWLVADYLELIAKELQHLGFQPTALYTVLIKTVAAPAMSLGMAQVGA